MLSKWLHLLNILFIIPSIFCDTNDFCDLLDEHCINSSTEILIKIIIEGIPKINIPTADPFHQDEIRISEPQMALTLSNVSMHGTKGCDLHRIRMYKDSWVFSMFCPNLILTSDYEINGDVDSMHIEGKGDLEVAYEKYLIGVYGGYDIVKGEDGKQYMNITYYKKDFIDVLGKAVYKFSNLFDGDNAKSVAVHDYINNNWMKLDDIIGDQVTFSLFGRYMDNVKRYTNSVPIKELFPKPNIALEIYH